MTFESRFTISLLPGLNVSKLDFNGVPYGTVTSILSTCGKPAQITVLTNIIKTKLKRQAKTQFKIKTYRDTKRRRKLTISLLPVKENQALIFQESRSVIHLKNLNSIITHIFIKQQDNFGGSNNGSKGFIKKDKI